MEHQRIFFSGQENYLSATLGVRKMLLYIISTYMNKNEHLGKEKKQVVTCIVCNTFSVTDKWQCKGIVVEKEKLIENHVKCNCHV